MAGTQQLPVKYPIAFAAGDDFTLTLTATESSAAYVWGTLTATIVGHATITAFTVTTPADGTAVLALTDAQTTTLGAGGYSWHLTATKAGYSQTWMGGTLTVTPPGTPGTSAVSATVTVTTGAATSIAITSNASNVAANVTFAPTGTIAATTVQAAIAEVSTDVTEHLADTTDAHDASAVSVLDTDGYYAGTNVEAVLAELPGKFSPRMTPKTRWLVLGDSIPNGSYSNNGTSTLYSRGYVEQAGRIAGGLVSALTIDHAVGGETSTQIAARAAAALAASASALAGVYFAAGTNDAATATALSTYTANLLSVATLARQYTVPLVVGACPPLGSGATASRKQYVAAYNTWIRANASRYGYTVADFDETLADTAGDLAATYDSGDGVHPNWLGHQEMAMVLARSMVSALGASEPRGLIHSVGGINLITNPLMLAGAGLPTGWAHGSGQSGTASTDTLVADTSGFLPAGQWAQFDVSAGAATVQRIISPNITVTAGNVIALTCHLQVEDVSGNLATNLNPTTNTAGISVNVVATGTNTGLASQTVLDNTLGLRRSAGVFDFGPLIFTFTPAATSYNFWLQMKVPSGSRYKYRLGCVGAFDASAYGLTDYLTWGTA